MVYGSVCSGIEAATAAWHQLGWVPAWFSEIEPFPCKVLNHHYPHVPNLGDMLKLRENEAFIKSIIDLIVGGTPCQSFSVAGLRGGITDQRGNLALEFCRLLIAKQPRWFVWENVPGIFSSFSDEEGGERTLRTQTADFATLLEAFQECGYSVSWRVLDAQYFGVPQRRRRVFVVGYLGNDWRPSAAVLFEPESLRRDFAKGGKKREGVTGTLTRRTKGRRVGAEEAAAGQVIAFGGNDTRGSIELASALNSKPTWHDFGTETLLYSIMPSNSCKDWKAKISEVTQPLTTLPGVSSDQGGDVVFSFQQSQSGTRMGEVMGTLDANMGPRRRAGIFQEAIVRRLTPLECERLQGFPDGYTLIPGASDSPRYEGLGNSMARPVMEWLGKRIDHVDKQMKALHGCQ